MTTVTATVLNTIATLVPNIPFNEEWSNGTGYMDGAVKPVLCDIGDTVASFCPEGRAIIIHCTRYGNVVLFNRHINSAMIVANYPRNLSALIQILMGHQQTFSIDAASNIVGFEQEAAQGAGRVHKCFGLSQAIENMAG